MKIKKTSLENMSSPKIETEAFFTSNVLHMISPPLTD